MIDLELKTVVHHSMMPAIEDHSLKFYGSYRSLDMPNMKEGIMAGVLYTRLRMVAILMSYII